MTYDEREMKFGFQFSFTYGVPSILIVDDGQEVVGNLVTKCPLVYERSAGGFEKRVKCVTLVVYWEGKIGDVENLGSGGNVLVKILEQKRFRVLGLIPYARNGSTKEERSKEVERVLLTIWGVTGHACGLVMLSEDEE